jgi:integrase
MPRKRDGIYQVIWYDPDTRLRKWVTTGTKSRSAAEIQLRKYVRAWEDGVYDPFSPKRFEIDLPTVRKTIDRYLSEIDVRPVTVNRYRGVLSLLLEELPSGLPIDRVRAADISKVVNRPASPVSSRTYFRTFRAFFRWAVQEGLIRTAPTDEVKQPKAPRRAPKFLSRSEYTELLSVISDPYILELVRFAVGSGLRSGEIRFLRFGDIDEELGLIYVQTRKGFHTKAGDRTVPLSPLARDAYENRLQAYPGKRVPADAYIFPSPKGGAISSSWIGHSVKRAIREAGLDEAYHFHTLRHTFASWLRIDGVPLDRIQEWLGHSSITTTEVYAHLSPENARDEILRSFPV